MSTKDDGLFCIFRGIDQTNINSGDTITPRLLQARARETSKSLPYLELLSPFALPKSARIHHPSL